MSENKPVRFADQISIKIGSREEFIGKETNAATLANMAATEALSSYEAIKKYKPGDQIEWTITLSGRTTVDQRMIEYATNMLLR